MTKRISWFSRKPWFNSPGSPIICYLNSRGSNASTEHLVVHGHIGGKTLSNTHRNQNNKISEIKHLLLKTLNINSNSSIKVHRLKDYWTGKQNLPFYCTRKFTPPQGKRMEKDIPNKWTKKTIRCIHFDICPYNLHTKINLKKW